MAFNLASELQEIAQKLGVADLEPDHDGHCMLSVDAFDVHIDHVPETDSVFVYSRIGSMPEDPPVELLSRLLQANFFVRETAGCTIGVDSFSDSIALFVRWSIKELEDGGFEERLLDFFEATDLWVRRIDAWTKSDVQVEPTLVGGIDGSNEFLSLRG
jgi:hypothetical protein